MFQSLSTRDNLTSFKARNYLVENEEKKSGHGIRMHQCYVEEQTKMRDSFMVESYKILKSMMGKLTSFLTYMKLTRNSILKD